ncbi:MAG: hypothetical protein AAF487_04205 [Bacteroidota bacterium]
MEDIPLLDTTPSYHPKRPVNLILLFLLMIGIGGAIGATTNAVNGRVSEAYFRNVMAWDFEGIGIAAIFQGLFEGLIYGFILGMIFTIGFAIITRKKAAWDFAKKQVNKIIFTIYTSWITGGLIAILLAFTLPEMYDNAFIGVPEASLPRAAYAWVGGSIWGAMFGGLFAVIYGLMRTHHEWKKMIRKI